jgi:uncharacterized membrane protein
VRVFAVWIHVLGVVVWLGGLMYQAHVLGPRARRGEVRAFAEAARGGRPIAWAALALIILTGFYNVTRLGPLEQVMQSGVALLLAGKLALVLILVTLAGQRDFAWVPRLGRALDAREDATSALGAIAWLDRVSIILGVIVLYLGVAISRR